uniref:hypothetical protein n=1 Tax=Phocaeicola vulgatus TaxID=821 RepID=UPI004027FFD4
MILNFPKYAASVMGCGCQIKGVHWSLSLSHFELLVWGKAKSSSLVGISSIRSTRHSLSSLVEQKEESVWLFAPGINACLCRTGVYPSHASTFF